MRTVLVVHGSEETLAKLEAFKTMDPEVQRYLVNRHKVGEIARTMKYETDEKLAYFVESLTPVIPGSKGFIRTQSTKGMSYNKKEKKLSIWFGEHLASTKRSPFLAAVMEDLGKYWFIELNEELDQMLMKRYLLEKIFRGTIRTKEQCVDAYLKTSLKLKGVSADLYVSVIKARTGDSFKSLSTFDVNNMLRFSVSPVGTLRYLLSNEPNYNTVSKIKTIISSVYVTGDKILWAATKDNFKTEQREQEDKIKAMDLLYKESGGLPIKTMKIG